MARVLVVQPSVADGEITKGGAVDVAGHEPADEQFDVQLVRLVTQGAHEGSMFAVEHRRIADRCLRPRRKLEQREGVTLNFDHRGILATTDLYHFHRQAGATYERVVSVDELLEPVHPAPEPATGEQRDRVGLGDERHAPLIGRRKLADVDNDREPWT
jgi:hypothetical protein